MPHIFKKKPQPSILPRHRTYSTSTVPSQDGTSPSSVLGLFTNELDRIAPRFEINGSQVTVLRTPSEFYDALKDKILNAQERIFLSTLYIGKSEYELISTLQQALRANPRLRLSILTDALRGTRESPESSCASLLAPLVQEFGAERVEIRMYHTPNLTGLRKKYIPKRINEGWGLQHMKLYGFDDEIIISGANLSSDYFTNRQDRYHCFSSKEITDYFDSIHSAISSLSFLVVPDTDTAAGYTLSWPKSNPSLSPLDSPGAYIKSASTLLRPLIQPTTKSTPSNTDANTVVYPLSQLTPLFPKSADPSTELPALESILTLLALPRFGASSWTFTAGYFNPSPLLTSLFLSTSSRSSCTVLTASPQANGFFGSRGVSGLLPSAYTLLARRFLESVVKRGKDESIVLKEWQRGTVGEKDGWTYHAKGLWISLPGESQPTMNVIGSSNYTKRSYSLDLEVGCLVVTRDEGLKKRLAEERDGLGDYASRVGMDEFVKTERRVGIQVRIAMWIVGLVGGAL